MKYGAQIETDRLLIRSWNLSKDNKEIFHELNSDEEIMQYFPHPRSRQVADELLEKLINIAKEDGYGWAAISLRTTGETIGFAGLSKVNFATEFTPATEIGWRLVVRHWGKGYATEAANALVSHGFDELKLDKIVAFAAPANTRSIAIMKKLGMRHEPSMDFDMPGFGEVQFARHAFYSLSRDERK